MDGSRLIVFGLLLKSMAFGGYNTTESELRPHGEIEAKHVEYIGCFAQGCLNYDHHPVISELVTPDSCTAICKNNGFPYAALYNQTECACSCEQTCRAKSLDDTYCGLPCITNFEKTRLEILGLDIFCGSYIAASLYTVTFENISYETCAKDKRSRNIRIPTRGTGEPADNQQSLVIPITAPVLICTVAIIGAIVARLLYKRNRRESTLATSHPNLQNKDQSAKVAKQNQSLNTPPTHALPSPPDPYVINQPHNSSAEDHSYHVYAEADQDKRLAQNPPDLNMPSINPHVMLRDDCTLDSDKDRVDPKVYHEYLDMLEEKRVESKSDTPDGTCTKDEDGYITPDVSLLTPSAPAQSTQVVYYSSKLPNKFRGDEGMSPQSPTSDGICVKDEEGYITPNVSLPTPSAPAQSKQVVYYSSMLPKQVQADEGLSPQSPSPIVYYASAIRKSDR